MIFTEHYDSPLGGILLAADEIGLTGLWLDGQKYFGCHLSAERRTQETPILTEARRWLDIYFTGREPDFLHCIPSALYSGRRYGRFFYRFHTGRPRHTERLHGSLPHSRDLNGCLRRQLAELSGTMKSPSSFPATGSLVPTAV